MKSTLFTALIIVLSALSVAECGDKSAIPLLRATGKKIQKDTDISDSILEHDIGVILLVLPSLTKENEERYKLNAARTIQQTSTVWMRVRGVSTEPKSALVMKKTELLTEKGFRTAATRFGFLTVTSKPEHAKVTVRSAEWGNTEISKWEEEGEHDIVIEKDGFKTHRGTVKVKRGHTVYDKTLEKE